MKKKLPIIICLIISISLLGYSGIKIFSWVKDNQKSEQIMEDLEQKVVFTQEEPSNVTVTQDESEIKEDDPYWDFINTNLVDVDLSELKKTNPQTVGWVSLKGTNINYPFVQTTDNSYYLTHDFYQQYNGGGWVFLDYRNNVNLTDKNSIIYAHGRANSTMFGSLKNILTQSWVNDQRNFIVQVSTEEKNTLWQVFSVYRIPNTNDYLTTQFQSDEEFNNFAQMLINRSNFDFKTTVKASDKILTLSTCYNNDEKVVLHAKLIKTN